MSEAEDEKWVKAQSEAEGLVQSPGKVFVHLELFHIKSQPESVFIGILSDRPSKVAQCEGEVDLKKHLKVWNAFLPASFTVVHHMQPTVSKSIC